MTKTNTTRTTNYDTETEEAPSADEALNLDGSFEEDDTGLEVDEEHGQDDDDEAALDHAATVENQGASGLETEDPTDIAESITNESPPIPPSEEEGAGNTDDTATEQQRTDEVEHHDADNEGDGEDSDDESSSNTGYNLRANRDRSYNHRFATTMDNPASSQSYEHSENVGHNLFQFRNARQPTTEERILHGWVMTQMSARAGIRRFGEAAKDAMRREFRQLDEKGVFEPIHASEITDDVKQQALRYINVIKEKRCGKIKGRTCADGRPQRDLYDKAETSSPTASSDAILAVDPSDQCPRAERRRHG